MPHHLYLLEDGRGWQIDATGVATATNESAGAVYWLDTEKTFLYFSPMGKIYEGDGWIIKVQGAEHPPVHVHLLHPDGKAIIKLDSTVVNSGVPVKVVHEARCWVAENSELILLEWRKMGNPEKRGEV